LKIFKSNRFSIFKTQNRFQKIKEKENRRKKIKKKKAAADLGHAREPIGPDTPDQPSSPFPLSPLSLH
jgi:hypothetical protein